jgi:hypothetical protein
MLSAWKVLFPEQNVHQYNTWNILLSTCTAHYALQFWSLDVHVSGEHFNCIFTKFMQYFRFRLVRLLYWKKKTIVSERALSIGPKWMTSHTLFKKLGNHANFLKGALFSGTPDDKKIPESEQS